MAYVLGDKSRERLEGVHPKLVAVVERAIGISLVDFTVLEGLRDLARQRKLLAEGKTTTLNSRHLTGHAVDLAPWPIDWKDTGRFVEVGEAMKQASRELGTTIVWGAAWNVTPLHGWKDSAESAVDFYVTTRRAQGKRPFMDYPHFELYKRDYP